MKAPDRRTDIAFGSGACIHFRREKRSVSVVCPKVKQANMCIKLVYNWRDLLNLCVGFREILFFCFISFIFFNFNFMEFIFLASYFSRVQQLFHVNLRAFSSKLKHDANTWFCMNDETAVMGGAFNTAIFIHRCL